MDTATETIEFLEKKDPTPLVDAAEPATAVLADSEMSDGVVPSVKLLPHVELKMLEVELGIKPG